MNKKIFIGAAAVLFCSFFALTAFKGKTKEEQMQEITAQIEKRLSDIRAAAVADCDARVQAAATTKFDSIQTAAANAPKTIAKPSTKKTYTKPKTTTKVTPTPAPVTPAPAPTAPPAPPKTDVDKKVESRLPSKPGTTAPADSREAKEKVDEAVKSRLPKKKSDGGGK